MTTPTDHILTRTSMTFRRVDKLGRTITIRPVTALDRLRLLKASGPELSQNDGWLSMAILALSVVELNGIPRVMPANERQIEAAVAELGDAGLQAVADVLAEQDDRGQLFDGPPEGNAEGTPN
jgi:hypothetical protein